MRMALYRYRGWDKQGRFVTGCATGPTASGVRHSLKMQGVRVLLLSRQWWIRIADHDVALFFLYLTYALQAGYPLAQSLAMMHESFRGIWAQVLLALHTYLQRGLVLSQACAQFPMIFSPTLITLLQLGEQTGRMVHACQQAHHCILQNRKQRQTVWKALAYPLLNLGFLAIAFGVTMHQIMPLVIDMMRENGGQPSWATGFLMALMHGRAWCGIAVTLTLLAGGLWCARAWLIQLGGAWLALPVYQQFCASLALLLKESVPMGLALQLACRQVKGRTWQPVFRQVVRAVYAGQTLSAALAHLPHFSLFYRRLIQAGEGTGHPVQALEAAVGLIDEMFRKRAERAVFWIAPIMMAMTGLLFWVLLEGAFLPLYTVMGGTL